MSDKRCMCFSSKNSNPAIYKAKLLKLSNIILDEAIDNLLKTCDEYRMMIDDCCNNILHLITSDKTDNVEIWFEELHELSDKARNEFKVLDKFIDDGDIENFSMLIALASANEKEYQRLRKIYLKLYKVKIDPVIELILADLTEPYLKVKEVLEDLQSEVCEDEPYRFVDDIQDTVLDFAYIHDYKELNSLAEHQGFVLTRCHGDHGIFKNSNGFIVVIPQGRSVGKGLSILIQKTIFGLNTKYNCNLNL